MFYFTEPKKKRLSKPSTKKIEADEVEEEMEVEEIAKKKPPQKVIRTKKESCRRKILP
jgi:hypothetical protein